MPRYPVPMAKAEEVITLLPPSKGQLNKIVKQRGTRASGEINMKIRSLQGAEAPGVK